MNSDIEQAESKKYLLVLQGMYSFADPEKNDQSNPSIITNGETIKETINRGFQVDLPPIGTAIEMDMMSCFGYLGTARVTYQGLEHEAWKAVIMSNSKPRDLEKRMLKCVDAFEDTAPDKFLTDPKNLSNSVFLIAPTDEKRKQIRNIKKPDWNEVFEAIPYEWLKTANLPRRNVKKERIESCIGNWTDSDGDGKIDLITLCAVNEEARYEYYRTLKLEGNHWRQFWQTVDSKN